jgi:hypothetical protein
VPPQAALRPIVLSLALACFLIVLTRLVLRRWTEAAVLTTLALLLFFAYGHVYALLRTVPTLGSTIGHHRYLVAVLLLLLAAGTAHLARHRVRPSLTLVLNLTGLLVVGLSLVTDGPDHRDSKRSRRSRRFRRRPKGDCNVRRPRNPPRLEAMRMRPNQRGVR